MDGTLKLEQLKTELINRLRWEDDGGKNTEPDQQFIQPVRTDAETHATFLQWNKQYVIGPFQAGMRIDSIRKKPSTNRPNM